MYKVGSMFAGIGGLCLGFKSAGTDIVWANEFDTNACKTYRENFGASYLIEKDIRQVKDNEIPDIDVLIGGWPCVAFSVAGRRNGMDYKCVQCSSEYIVNFDEYLLGTKCSKCGGEVHAKDDRGTLFYEMVRVLRAKKPRAFLFENVKNLISMKSTFATIKETLENEGYYFTYQVLNSMEYGNVPQNRERVFIVGFKHIHEYHRFTFPDKTPLSKSIHDIIQPDVKKNDKYYYHPTSPYYQMIQSQVLNKDTVYQIRRIYIRENQSNVCPTLTANMGTGGHNVPIVRDQFGVRKLTPAETLALQGFPADFKIPQGMADSHIYKQAGNSVTVPVIEAIAKQIIDVLDSKNYKDMLAV